MENDISPLAKGILDGLREVLQDAQGIKVEGMRKTEILNLSEREKNYPRGAGGAVAPCWGVGQSPTVFISKE